MSARAQRAGLTIESPETPDTEENGEEAEIPEYPPPLDRSAARGRYLIFRRLKPSERMRRAKHLRSCPTTNEVWFESLLVTRGVVQASIQHRYAIGPTRLVESRRRRDIRNLWIVINKSQLLNAIDDRLGVSETLIFTRLKPFARKARASSLIMFLFCKTVQETTLVPKESKEN